ncbi:phosphonate ABC transporter substrate-binding protein [Marinobacter sp. M3C]|jgi:phosphonate transport system substrate-binding protein|uniref:phosphonate ABC transporter substrate-binding protein n=1 Tax=unclassified Marinobacter TaxID=83889 RepID=UPI00200BC175|nr:MULTISPECIES: phosphonate ABC transporter substrate-binding protein [unclassified Marinobacter]MCL1478912.1 phosphonate ABC transporter substrate-binding protein [Marinobacter sp.]MCL1480602.1 phosphonate ABC transporter substrate-binding protein [Marinobacter sp.]MCL1484165.1 phosphonate ABC transporter substrate-binding protein [Marinobacter sp.]MCL1487507.1 phosphonate ABC transporter substrate-binding protein [Marinobacter sp.]UQG57731.1 phosphonate ABC transporter substrate-binding pro
MFKQWIGRMTLAAAVTVGAAGLQAEELNTLNFGIISTESSSNLKGVWEPFLEDMSAKLDMEVKGFFAPDYAGIIQAMRFDKVDIAWYGNKSAMEAVDRAGGEIMAQTVAADGSPGYWSLMIVHKDSTHLNTVADVLANAKDLTFGNGDPNSTSGFLVPSYYIFAKNGVNPKEAFKRTLNSSHETNAMAVANKQVDVATFNTESMARLQLTFPEKADNLKVIWKSPLIPSDPLVWRKNLPAQTKQKVYDFLMSYGTTGDEKELKILADLQWAPFRASSNDQLIPIRQLEMFKQKAAIENDIRYSAQEKTEKLADIEAQLAGLDRRLAALDAAREESN